MAKPERKSKVERDKYSEFLSALELYSIALVRSTFRVNRKEYLTVDDTDVSFKLSSKSQDVKEAHFDVCSTLNLRVISEQSRTLQLWVSATFELHFHGAPLDPEFIRRFCDSEIRLIVWPYFREYVGNISARMHVPPFVLPLQGNKSRSSRDNHS